MQSWQALEMLQEGPEASILSKETLETFWGKVVAIWANKRKVRFEQTVSIFQSEMLTPVSQSHDPDTVREPEECRKHVDIYKLYSL